MKLCAACGGRLPKNCRDFCRRCVWLITSKAAKGATEIGRDLTPDPPSVNDPNGDPAVEAGRPLQLTIYSVRH